MFGITLHRNAKCVHVVGIIGKVFCFAPCLEVSPVSETDAPGADLRRADPLGLPGARAAVVRRDAPRRTRLRLAVEVEVRPCHRPVP